jgi:hypothetical protein
MLPVKLKPSSVRLRNSFPVVGDAAENSRLVMLLHDTVTPGTARRCNTCRVLEPVYHTSGRVPVRPLTSSSTNVARVAIEPHVGGTVLLTAQQNETLRRRSSRKVPMEDHKLGRPASSLQLLTEIR